MGSVLSTLQMCTPKYKYSADQGRALTFVLKCGHFDLILNHMADIDNISISRCVVFLEGLVVGDLWTCGSAPTVITSQKEYPYSKAFPTYHTATWI